MNRLLLKNNCLPKGNTVTFLRSSLRCCQQMREPVKILQHVQSRAQIMPLYRQTWKTGELVNRCPRWDSLRFYGQELLTLLSVFCQLTSAYAPCLCVIRHVIRHTRLHRPTGSLEALTSHREASQPFHFPISRLPCFCLQG
jgi:hypothetical protein